MQFFFSILLVIIAYSPLIAGYELPRSAQTSPTYEYYKPQHIDALMQQLPEFVTNRSPDGYVCELRQAPPVWHNTNIQYARNTGYREADWGNNHLYDNHLIPVNSGGYNY